MTTAPVPWGIFSEGSLDRGLMRVKIVSGGNSVDKAIRMEAEQAWISLEE